MDNNEIDYKRAAEQLRNGEPLFGKDGALAPMLERILNAALEGEMDAPSLLMNAQKATAVMVRSLSKCRLVMVRSLLRHLVTVTVPLNLRPSKSVKQSLQKVWQIRL